MSENFRETLCTVDKLGRRKWVYASLVKGRFFAYRRAVAYVLMALYVLAPWVSIRGKQAVLLDFVHQRFIFFGVEFWSTETHYLFFLFGILAFSLFFFTAFLGRVWCGWACPETIFLEFLFRPIERFFEGSPAQRKRLDEQPWSVRKLRKKAGKHLSSAFAAWILASTTIAYFVGREPLLEMMTDWPNRNPVPFAVTCALMGLLAFQFGWFREQFCSILCPYARFQSVLLDSDTIVVGYDVRRGEPRSKPRRTKAGEPQGDCVDCGLCVRVCPAGIDIRNGMQLECVSCTACIDACDSVMERLGRPRGLVRYDSENSLLWGEGRGKLLRPRPLIYGILLLLFVLLFVYSLATRSLGDFQVLRGALDKPYALLADGRVSNHFHVRVSNKGRSADSYTLRGNGETGLELITPLSPFSVKSGAMNTVPLFVNFSSTKLVNGKKKIKISIVSEGGFSKSQTVTLLGPDD